MNHSVFLKELMHWSVHTTICATPSFVLAIMAGFNSVSSILAMLFGIVTMTLLYSAISSRPEFSGNPTGVLSRAAC